MARTQPAVRTARLLTCLTAMALSGPASAVIIVDPNGLGATDLRAGVTYPGGPYTIPAGVTALPPGDNLLPKIVGYTDVGEIRIANTSPGGTLFRQQADLRLGDRAGSLGIITVDGNGSSLRMEQFDQTLFLRVGYRGSGLLDILNGGRVTAEYVDIGRQFGSTGRIRVKGFGARFTADRLAVGQGTRTRPGDSRLTIESLGLAVIKDLDVWGTLDLFGGTLETVVFDRNESGVINHADGTLRITQRFSPNVGSAAYDINSLTGGTSILELVDDSNASLSGELRVATSGNGQLLVSESSSISNTAGTVGLDSGSVGSVTVTGAGSIWSSSGGLIVGSSGQGTLRVESGGRASSARGDIGVEVGSVGDVTVTGAGSTWSNSGVLNVGERGSGTLNIGAGAGVSSLSGSLGVNANSTGTVDVSGGGATWTTGSLLVGQGGEGTLNIRNGGVVSNTALNTIALATGSTGTVTVAGAGSAWNSDAGFIVGGAVFGSGGTATLNIQDQGRVATTDPNAVGLLIWETGTVHLDGGTLDTTAIDHTRGGTFDFNAGTLRVDRFFGNLEQFGGTLAPGNSPGLTEITGAYDLDAGTLAIEIGGLDPAVEYDQVTADTAELGVGSVLDVALLNDFAPALGDTFTLLDTAGSITGTFGAETLPSLGGGLAFDVIYTTNQVLLEVVAASLAGDYNGDGSVDAADYTVWRDNLDSSITLPGDTTPGTVTSADFDVWRSNYGASSPAPSVGQSAAPEPNAFLLLGLGIVSLVAARSRRS